MMWLTALCAAATYSVSVTGSDAADGTTAPWATFAHALPQLQPGDTLLLEDGTFTEALVVLVSGTPSAPITIRARHDGAVTIDGQGTREPCSVGDGSGTGHDVALEGFSCRNSSGALLQLDRVQAVSVRRLSLYEAGPGNSIGLDVNGCDGVLIEDVAVSGRALIMVSAGGSSHLTLRRVWVRWSSCGCPALYVAGIELNGVTAGLIENCVVTVDPSGDLAATYREAVVITSASVPGIVGTRVLGNVFEERWTAPFITSSLDVNISGTRYEHDVSFGGDQAVYLRADDAFVVRNLTSIAPDQTQVVISQNPGVAPSFAIAGALTESVLVGGVDVYEGSNHPNDALAHAYNLISADAGYRDSPLDATESFGEPRFDTAVYGRGGYLFAPHTSPQWGAGPDGGSLGATVLYRYQDGALTPVPLWPWPMESRIAAETGLSVTWEDGGGLWRTLDGVYPLAPDAGLAAQVLAVRCGCGAAVAGPFWLALALLAARRKVTQAE